MAQQGKRASRAFDGTRQRAALRALQQAATDAGRSITVVAGELHLSDGHYRRYLNGKVPLRTDQLSAFAHVFGITKAALVEAIGLLEEDDIEQISQGDRALAKAMHESLDALPAGPRKEVLCGLRQVSDEK